MKSLFKSKKWFLRVGMFLAIPVVLFSCFHLRAVYYPEVVKTNSTFEVVMVADMQNPLDGGVCDRNAYGFLGVLLPVGWTIDEESVVYDYTGKGLDVATGDWDYEKGKPYDYQAKTGKLLFNEEMTNYCIELDPEKWGDEYYWQGFRTDERLRSGNLDSVVVRFNVTTNDQVGDYFMFVGIQECSYDKDKNIPAGEPGNTLKDNKGNAPFYQTGEPSNDEYSKEYLTITVEQGSGISVKYSEKDKKNYAISSTGNGQVLVHLQNEAKIGATAVLYDMNGRQVASQQLTQIDNVLNTTLKSGVYFVSIQKDGVRSTQKVLVK